MTGGADTEAKAKVEEKQGVPTTLGEDTATKLPPTPDDHIIPGTTVALVGGLLCDINDLRRPTTCRRRESCMSALGTRAPAPPGRQRQITKPWVVRGPSAA